MTITKTQIETALRAEDIESLLAVGAPQDEYATEAGHIARALEKLPDDQFTLDNLVAIIALIWTRAFNRSADDIARRLPAFRRIAQNLLQDH